MTTNRLNLGVILAGERITWPQGVLKYNFIRGGSAWKANPLTFHTPFLTEKFLLSCLLTPPPPFTDLVYDTASLSTAVNSLFLNVIQSLNQKVSWLFHSHRMHLPALFSIVFFLPTKMTDFPILSYTSITEIPTEPFQIPEALRRYSFGRSLAL